MFSFTIYSVIRKLSDRLSLPFIFNEVEDCVCWHDVLKLVKQILCYKWVQKGLMVTKLEQVNYQPIEHHL